MFRMWRGKRRTRPGKNPTTAPPTTKQNHSHFRGELGNAGTLSRAQGGDTLEDALAHLRRRVFFVFPHRPGSWTPRDPLRGSMRVSPRSFPPPRRDDSVHDTSATTIRVSREKRFVRIATHYDSVASSGALGWFHPRVEVTPRDPLWRPAVITPATDSTRQNVRCSSRKRSTGEFG